VYAHFSVKVLVLTTSTRSPTATLSPRRAGSLTAFQAKKGVSRQSSRSNPHFDPERFSLSVASGSFETEGFEGGFSCATVTITHREHGLTRSSPTPGALGGAFLRVTVIRPHVSSAHVDASAADGVAEHDVGAEPVHRDGRRAF
jgi:hypothetical protein